MRSTQNAKPSRPLAVTRTATLITVTRGLISSPCRLARPLGGLRPCSYSCLCSCLCSCPFLFLFLDPGPCLCFCCRFYCRFCNRCGCRCGYRFCLTRRRESHSPRTSGETLHGRQLGRGPCIPAHLPRVLSSQREPDTSRRRRGAGTRLGPHRDTRRRSRAGAWP